MFSVTTAIIALAILVVAFLIGSITELHMGIMAIVATAIVGPLLFHDTIKQVEGGFPLVLFFTLLGVTYLFALASANGTVNWIVAAGLRLVAGRARLFPFVMFAISALVTAIGAATPASAAILMPIALGFNRKNKINPLPMSQAVIQGSTAGSFSPIGMYGVIVNTVVKRSPGLAALYNPTVTWILVAVICFLIVLATWFLHRDAGPSEEEVAATSRDDIDDAAVKEALVDEEFGEQQAGATSEEDLALVRLNPERTTTLIGLAVMALLVIGAPLVTAAFFGKKVNFDVGLTALAVGAVLTLMFPKSAKGAVSKISWPTILLVGGIVTYIDMLERHGVIQWLGDLAANLGNPRISSVIILFIGALVSAYASTTGTLGALIPLSVPFLVPSDDSTAAINATMLVAALGISSSTVDCSPFSTNGALGIANGAYQGDYIYRWLLKWSWILIIGTPLVTWALMILPPWWGAGS